MSYNHIEPQFLNDHAITMTMTTYMKKYNLSVVSEPMLITITKGVTHTHLKGNRINNHMKKRKKTRDSPLEGRC